MRKSEIKVGGLYTARVSGRFVTVRVDSIRLSSAFGGNSREVTVYEITNLATGRKTQFRSAAKFRAEVQPQDAGKATFDQRAQETIEAAPADVEGEDSSDPTPVPASGVEEAAVSPDVIVETQPLVAPGATVQAGTVSKLAARLAAASQPRATGLTLEQENILATAKMIETVRNDVQRVMVIGAGAGTGKTFTLKQLELVLTGNGQYTAFNSSLVAESKAKFSRAACNTTHSLAFRAVGRRFSHRLNGARVKSYAVANALGITDQYVELPESVQPADAPGKPATRRLKAAWLAGQVIAAIRKFCMSDERLITCRCFKRIDGIDAAGEYTNSDKVRDYLLPFADKMWADLSSETGTLPFSHDCYVKIWQLGTGADRPVIAADYILLDEAQDTAPVMLDILKQQTHALIVLVGDDNQQIYEWRGAVNAMAAFPGAPRRLLSQSFRFGQTVADVANAVLAGLDEPTDLIMRGLESIPTRICQVAEPRCYLYRTNAGAIGRLMSAMAEGKRGHLIGGSADVVKFCKAAEDLQAGIGTEHPELGCFGNWGEVQEYSKEDEGADLRLMVKLIDEFGAAEIRLALDGMPKEEDADLILSTAHRSKGREWASVKLGPDFPLANKLSDADRRLVYVAATRAQEELDISSCPTFCGGWDKQGGGEGGEAKWVPGIKINYTTTMPTVEELDAYRAAKSAPKPAIVIPTTTPVSAPIVASTPVPTNGNIGFTWASMNGAWMVRGPKDRAPGERVTVLRKDGSSAQVVLGDVGRKIGDLWFYAVR